MDDICDVTNAQQQNGKYVSNLKTRRNKKITRRSRKGGGSLKTQKKRSTKCKRMRLLHTTPPPPPTHTLQLVNEKHHISIYIYKYNDDRWDVPHRRLECAEQASTFETTRPRPGTNQYTMLLLLSISQKYFCCSPPCNTQSYTKQNTYTKTDDIPTTKATRGGTNKKTKTLPNIIGLELPDREH